MEMEMEIRPFPLVIIFPTGSLRSFVGDRRTSFDLKLHFTDFPFTASNLISNNGFFTIPISLQNRWHFIINRDYKFSTQVIQVTKSFIQSNPINASSLIIGHCLVFVTNQVNNQVTNRAANPINNLSHNLNLQLTNQAANQPISPYFRPSSSNRHDGNETRKSKRRTHCGSSL